MATTLRAAIMLVVLVGLPAAWVYYGPLPPEAMGAIKRTIIAAKQSFGLSELSLDATLATTTQSLSLQQQQVAHERAAKPLPPAARDGQFTLASATLPTTTPANNQDLANQLEPHLSLLRSQGAEEYTLEMWGGKGQFYRFRCAIPWGAAISSDAGQNHTRQFEAIAASPLQAVRDVVGEVTSWQNARLTTGNTRWQ